jgi:hypothetical protein
MIYVLNTNFLDENEIKEITDNIKGDYIFADDLILSLNNFKDSQELTDFLKIVYEMNEYGVDKNNTVQIKDIVEYMKTLDNKYFTKLYNEIKITLARSPYDILENNIKILAKAFLIKKLYNEIEKVENNKIEIW